MDRMRMYDIIYALAAKDSRETALFGNCAPCAREALSRSLAGEKLPEIWLEVPLSGDPWFDIHALTAYEDVAGTQAAFAGQGGSYADALSWFAAQPPMTVRQLALSYDTHAGDVDHPAVQLLVCGRDKSVPLEVLEAIGLSSAKPSYRTFAHNMPKEWFACYIGAFPRRQATDSPPWVRVECLVGKKLQRELVPFSKRQRHSELRAITVDRLDLYMAVHPVYETGHNGKTKPGTLDVLVFLVIKPPVLSEKVREIFFFDADTSISNHKDKLAFFVLRGVNFYSALFVKNSPEMQSAATIAARIRTFEPVFFFSL